MKCGVETRVNFQEIWEILRKFQGQLPNDWKEVADLFPFTSLVCNFFLLYLWWHWQHGLFLSSRLLLTEIDFSFRMPQQWGYITTRHSIHWLLLLFLPRSLQEGCFVIMTQYPFQGIQGKQFMAACRNWVPRKCHVRLHCDCRRGNVKKIFFERNKQQVQQTIREKHPKTFSGLLSQPEKLIHRISLFCHLVNGAVGRMMGHFALY